MLDSVLIQFFSGQIETAKILHSYGAFVDAEDDDKRTPLFEACAKGKNCNIISQNMFIDHNNSVKSTGRFEITFHFVFKGELKWQNFYSNTEPM